MLKTIISTLFDALNTQNIAVLGELIDENCILINYDSKATLSKTKVIQTLTSYNMKQLNLINTVQDSVDTLLIAYSVLMPNGENLFGSSIIRFKDHKINHLKVIIIK